jgi:hypothetical protein
LRAAADALAPQRLAAVGAGAAFDDELIGQPAFDAPTEPAIGNGWDDQVAASHADEPESDVPSFEVAGDRFEPAPASPDFDDQPSGFDNPQADFDNQLNESVEIEAPPIAPVDLDEVRLSLGLGAGGPSGPDAEPPENIESIAARRFGKPFQPKQWHWPLSLLQTAIVVLAILDIVVIGWRNGIVRLLPQTASFYASIGLPVNLRDVVFQDIATTMEQHEGVPILVVEGNIVNDARKAVDVPRIKFAVRNASNQEIYSWTAVPPRGNLAPGEAVAFHSRLASPPPESRDVLVRFLTRRDIVAGTP